MRAPEEIAALPPGSLDVVVLHSVAQYLTPEELDNLLVLFRRLLGADGVFILGDIIPPHVSALGDAAALLHFAARNGFLAPRWSGSGAHSSPTTGACARISVSPATARAAVMEKLTLRAGFSAQRAPANIGHNPARMTFLARPA